MSATFRFAFLSDIQSIVGPAGLLRDRDATARYCRDWSGDTTGVPCSVVRPRTVEQVASLVRLCAKYGTHLVPQGGNTGLVGGAIPSAEGDELVLSLELLNGIREVDAMNFSMTVEAGCVLETVKAEAARHGFIFPLALGSQGSCQIGGAIATNAGGLNVLRYGMMRELVLGLEVVMPDGRVWSGLKKLRKDNAGYDVKQLLLGSEGTLGIVTAAVLKLFPLPSQVETAFVALPSIAAVVELYGLARRELSDLLSAFELLTRESVDFSGCADPLARVSPVYVLLEASASGPIALRPLLESFLEGALARGLIADGIVAASGAQAAAFWRIRESIIEAQLRGGKHLRTDVSVPISAIEPFVDGATRAVKAISAEAIILAYGHVGDGNLHFNLMPPAGVEEGGVSALLNRCEEAIFEVLDDLNGSISAEHGIGRVKREAFLARLTPVHADLLSGIKRAFDPKAIMCPGRMIGASRHEV